MPTASDTASQVMASYADAATPAAAASWTDGSAQAGAADASMSLGGQHSHHHGAASMTETAGGTTDHVRMHHS